MVLNRLPDDLKILVFHHVDVYDRGNGWWRWDNWPQRSRNRDLASVVHCCHSFYNLAVPILYSSFDGDGPGGKARSVAFLRTILARPELANYCQRLSSYCLNQESKEIRGFNKFLFYRPLSPLVRLKGLKDALRQGCDDKSLRRRWHKSFSPHWSRYDEDGKLLDIPLLYIPGNWDSITALLILLLPNISTPRLLINGMDPQGFEFLPYVFARASKLQALNVFSAFSFSRLRSIEITVDQYGQKLALNSLLPFLQLKSMREVNLPTSSPNLHFISYDDDDGISDFLPHITHLTFAPGGEIEPRAFARLLQPFCGLTHFLYVNLLTFGSRSSYPNPPQIKDGLLVSKGTLQGLVLVNLVEEKGLPDRLPELPLGCLLEFRQLRWLDVTAYVFLGLGATASISLGLISASPVRPKVEPDSERYHSRAVEGLPETLEELTLRACSREIYTTMEILFARKRLGRLKRLKEVALYFKCDFSEQQILQDLAGIQCELDGSQAGIHVARHTSGYYIHMFGCSYDHLVHKADYW